jgi:signal transduction histidine kinase
MTSTGRTIFIVCADSAVTHECINVLIALDCHAQLLTASSVEEARRKFRRTPPDVVFLDESAVDAARGGSLESTLSLLNVTAPVVVAAGAERQAELASLIRSGSVDFVMRAGRFVTIVAGLLDRRLRMDERMAEMIQFPNDELAEDFGEILRHEVNNPLTGILGNTELLLARRDRLPPTAIERLQTIAELAVRLRETVRHLSNAWEKHHEHARSV